METLLEALTLEDTTPLLSVLALTDHWDWLSGEGVLAGPQARANSGIDSIQARIRGPMSGGGDQCSRNQTSKTPAHHLLYERACD